MILCIDTATEYSGIALVGNEKKNGFLPLERAHTSDSIIKKIDQLVKKADIRLSDIKGVFVVKGPGSFTGLRVGISVANQFAHQLEVPIVGICCDELYSYMTKEKDYFYIQSMNTDQVYMVGYGKLKRDFPREIVSISECHHELVEIPGLAIFGQISEAHKEYFKGIKKILSNESSMGAWVRLSQENPFNARKKYQLIEPYYAKNPTITISNKKI